VAAGQVSADPRARRRRTLHPDQWALPLSELADADQVYGYGFIVTNLDVTTAERVAAVEHWYRHRTQIENLFLLRGSQPLVTGTKPQEGALVPAPRRVKPRCWFVGLRLHKGARHFAGA
jgi:hypothetical protein